MLQKTDWYQLDPKLVASFETALIIGLPLNKTGKKRIFVNNCVKHASHFIPKNLILEILKCNYYDNINPKITNHSFTKCCVQNNNTCSMVLKYGCHQQKALTGFDSYPTILKMKGKFMKKLFFKYWHTYPKWEIYILGETNFTYSYK